MSIILNSVTTSPTDDSKVPSEYTVINSITSSGTQWIDTGYKPSVDTEIYARFSWIDQTTAWAVFWGVTSNDKSSDGIIGRLYWDGYTGNQNTFNPWFCNTTYSEGTRDVGSTGRAYASISQKKGGTSYGVLGTSISSSNIPGALIPTTTTGTPYSGNIYLFCGNNGGSAWRHSKCTIYRFKISEGGKMVRDFIPVQKTSDSSVKGLYDLIEGKFYGNSGTGTFS